MSAPSLNEIYALRDIYESTNGSGWNWRNNTSLYGYTWNASDWASQNPCSLLTPWQGVNCTEQTNDTSTITALRLDVYGLLVNHSPDF